MQVNRAHMIWSTLAAGGVLLVLASATALFLIARRLPPMSDARSEPAGQARWPRSKVPDSAVWQTLAPGVAPAAAVGPLAGRFRLAGTFFVQGAGGDGAGAVRKAILDDTKARQQMLLSEGDLVDGIQVARIADDHVQLRAGAAEETIWLSFLGAGGAATSAPVEVASSGVTVAGEATLESNRFGRRVGRNRWVLQREELVRYYQELLDDPERVAALYVSMKPDYRDQAIAGYRLDVAGEQDFFTAVGMQQGDVVRKVNSMLMTSQKRAEYFIGEFMKNRVNAFVLDVEREGKPEQLIYLIR